MSIYDGKKIVKYQDFFKKLVVLSGAFWVGAFASGCTPERPSDVEANLTRTQSGGESADGDRAASSQAVAVINNEVLTLAEFERRISTLAEFAQARFSTVESKQDYLVDVVQFEVLADEAERRGYGNDALTLQAMKGEMARGVLENELRNRVQVGETVENTVDSQPLSGEGEKSATEEWRLIVLRADSEEEAVAFRAQIEARDYETVADRVQTFRILAHRYSTERLSADRGGDKGFVAVEDLSRETSGEQVFELKEIGDLSMPYEVEDGWQLAMLFEKRLVESATLSAEDANAQARREHFERRRDTARAEFVGELMRSADVEVFSERLAELPLSPRRGMSTDVDSIRPDQK